MALSSVAITGNIADLLGTDFDTRRTKIWVSTNIESGTVIDTAGNAIRLGTGNVTLNDDGTFTASVWIPGTGSNPDTWQTYIHVDYPDRNAPRGRATRTFGPFTITAAADLADLVEEQEVPAEYLTTVTTLLDGYVTDAEAARDETQALRDGIVGDLGTTDSQTATLINTPSSLTASSLSASIEAVTDPIEKASPKPTLTHPAGLIRFKKALAKALFSQARVLIEGDSITVGANANNATTSTAADQLLWAQRGFAGQIRRLFQSTYGDVGEGWVTFGSDEGRWTYTGTTSASPAGPIATGRQINAGGTATATALGGGGTFTTLDMCVYHVSGASVPRVSVDGTDKTPTKLSTTQDAFAVGASDWANRASCTVAHTTISGSSALAITAASTGNIAAQTPIGTSARPVTAGDAFMVDFEIQTDAAAGARSARGGAIFYDAAGSPLASGELTTTNITTVPGSKVSAAALITAPTGAVYMNAIVRIDSAVSGEIHNVTRLKQIPLTTKVTGLSSVTLYRFSISGLADTDHAVSIATGPSGNMFLVGAILRRNTTTGVVVHRVGKSGSTTGDHVGSQYTGGSAGATATNMRSATYSLSVPDLAIICLGANDIPNQVSNGITPAIFKANLQTMIDAVVAGGGCVLLVAGPRYSTEVSGGSTQATYYQQMADLATANTHVAYVDPAGELWVSRATSESVGFQNNSLYGIHPTLEGHGDFARALFSAITRPSVAA